MAWLNTKMGGGGALGLDYKQDPYSTLIFSSLIISVRHKCAATFPIVTFFIVYIYIGHIFINTKFKHVISTYYHCGTDNIMWNIPIFSLNVKNIMHILSVPHNTAMSMNNA
jgi:hypothetical protein